MNRHYHILPLKGGTQSKTYYARHQDLDQERCIKSLDHLIGQQEMQILVSLNHPTFARIFDGWQVEGKTEFAMEWIPGFPLSEIEIPLPKNGIPSLFAPILYGLHALHEKGFVHGDLHPENLILNPSGQFKLIDLELTTPLGQELQVGTPGFLTKDHLPGKKASMLSDLQGVCLLLLFSQTGKAPFSLTWETNCHELQKASPDLSALSQPLQDWWTKAWNAEFEDCEEAAEVLELIPSQSDDQWLSKYNRLWDSHWATMLRDGFHSHLQARNWSEAQSILATLEKHAGPQTQRWKELADLQNVDATPSKQKKKTPFLLLLLAFVIVIAITWPKKQAPKLHDTAKEALRKERLLDNQHHQLNQVQPKKQMQKIWTNFPQSFVKFELNGSPISVEEGGVFLSEGSYKAIAWTNESHSRKYVILVENQQIQWKETP